MRTLSRHMSKYPKARASTLQAKARQDETNAALKIEIARMKRQKRIEQIKRAFRRAVGIW